MRTLLTFAILTPLLVAQKLPDCGFEGHRPCHPFDNEFWVNGNAGCDRGLKINVHNFFDATDDTCEDDTRHNPGKDYSWVGWALSQQRYNIGRSQPINWITHLNGHNSYNNNADNYQFPNQAYSITGLLNLGVRAIDLDLHWVTAQLRVCHGDDDTNSGCIAFDRLYAYPIKEIANWLDDNPGEVIIVEFENTTSEHDPWIIDPIQQYLGSKVWTYQTNRDYGVDGRLPTMQEMIEANKQVLFLTTTNHGVTGDWVIANRYNPFDTSEAKNVNPSQCAGFGTDSSGVKYSISLIPQYNPVDEWMEVYEARSTFDIGNPAGTLGVDSVASLTRCGVSAIGLDFIDSWEHAPIYYSETAPDTRRQAMVWSWAEGDTGQNGNLALFRGDDGRWISQNGNDVTNKHKFACALPQTGDPRTWPDKARELWWTTQTTGNFFQGQGLCSVLGRSIGRPDLVFAAPTNGYSNDKLRQLAGPGAQIWINNSIEPIPNPALTPSILDIYYAQGTADMPVQAFTVWGTPKAPIVFTPVTAAGGDWLRFTPDSNVVGDNGTKIAITLNPQVATMLARGTYGATIQVQLPNEPHQPTTTMQIFLHVQMPTSIELTTDASVGDVLHDVVFHVKLHYAQAGEFQANGNIELRWQTPDPNTGITSVSTLATAVVNSTSDDNTQHDNEVTFLYANLPPGVQQLAAFYRGDDQYAASLSPTLTFTVRYPPNITLAATPPRIAQPGQDVTLTAVATSPGGVVTGAVNFFDGDTFLGQVQLVNGQASFLVPHPAAGTHLFLGSYIRTGVLDGTSLGPLNYYVGSPTPVTIVTAPPGLPVIVDGAQYSTPVTFQWVFSDTHVMTALTVSQPDYIRDFSHWDDGSPATRSIGVRGTPLTLALTYAEQFRLYTTNINGIIAISPPSGTGYYSRGEVVTLTATPSSGFAFWQYTGDASGTQKTTILSINSVLHVGAQFTRGVLVNVQAVPPGMPFAVDGVNYTFSQNLLWAEGSPHTLSAQPIQPGGIDWRYELDTWTTGPVDLGAGATETTVTATFGVNTYYARYIQHNKLTATAGAGGSIALDPPSADGFYRTGSPVTVTAVPRSGFTFTGFTGALTGTTNPQAVSMGFPRVLTANFAADPVTPPAPPDIVVSIPGKAGNANARVWTVQLEQSAGTPLASAQVTGVLFTPAAGATCNVITTTAMPAVFTPFTAGIAAQAITFDFSACPAAARFRVDFTIQAGGTVLTRSVQNQFR